MKINLAKYQFPLWSIPIALLITTILGYGLLIPSLGFYWDDWPILLVTRTQGIAGFPGFFMYNRPFSAWTYMLTVPILGINPLAWQIFTLSLRWLTAVLFWFSLHHLWPTHRFQAAMAGFLFLAYPVFTQQAISVAFSQHWICYLLFMYSMASMIYAYRKPTWFWPLYLSSLIASGLGIFTMEYFLGLELLRPLVIWLIESDKIENRSARFKAVIKSWGPYAIVLIIFIIWRLFVVHLSGSDPNNPILLFNLVKKPFQAIPHLVQIAFQDVVYILISVWNETIRPELVNLNDHFLLASWALVILTICGVAFYLSRIQRKNQSDQSDPWAGYILAIGLLGIFLGMLTIWLADRQVIVGLYSSRFGLPAMVGASLVWVALIDLLTDKPAVKSILIAVLVALSIGYNIRNENDFRWSWVLQTRFYWQLHWRAPSVAPNTAFFADGEIFPFVGQYSTASGINLLYAQGQDSLILPYYFFSLGRVSNQQTDDLIQGMDINKGLRNYQFHASSKGSILFSYEPSQGHCLWILDSDYQLVPDVPELSSKALNLTNLAQIQADGAVQPVDGTIFGKEPPHDWCYYFEKADLAAQQGDWHGVVSLGEQAKAKGYNPLNQASNTAAEWLPFIKGYALTGNWNMAQEISFSAAQRDRRMIPALCTVWKNVISSKNPASDVLAGVNQKLNCNLPLNP